ncbi:hypothetical protein [Winogradskyella sp. 3972H.M.0a.05]|uniref:hypothetical protein n=1 Tax=Winogradskyella sp. 3972H.M.0a.05 TaxID=2950277 RepID=UPI003397690E
MKENNQQIHALHSHIGKLFYAITAADGIIRPEEYNTFKNIIKKEVFGENINHELILDSYNKLYLDDANAEASFDSFITFIEKNKPLFTEELKSLILKVSGILARSVNNVNKSELVLIAKLSLAFKN